MRHGYKALWLMFLMPLGLLAWSLYWQFVLGEQPCTLCVIQRIFLILITLWALLPLIRIGLRDKWWISGVSMALVTLTQGANFWQMLLQWQKHHALAQADLPAGICAIDIVSPDSFWSNPMLAGGGDCSKGMMTILGMPALYWIALALLLLLVLHIAYWLGIRQVRQSQVIAQSKAP